jgi:hypothetical protein
VLAHPCLSFYPKPHSRYLDPNAAYFLGKFLTVPRENVLTEVSSIDAGTATALGGITEQQWPLLQGYVASLVPTWGKMVYTGWLQAGGGGLLMTRPIVEWLYGFEDPILLSAAQGMAGYKLMPWIYKPSLALSFSSRDEPLEWLHNGEYTGTVHVECCLLSISKLRGLQFCT